MHAHSVLSDESTYLDHVTYVRRRYKHLDKIQRSQRARELARTLGITEAQWVASQCGACRSIPLALAPQEIIQQLGRLGHVMGLTRNDFCVIEKYGTYENIHTHAPVGIVHGEAIDLRVFFTHWKHIWAVEECGRNSLQFFDQSGQAVHKIFCTDQTHTAEYVSLVGEYGLSEPYWPQAIEYGPELTRDEPESFMTELKSAPADSARSRLQQAWLAMTDTHDFYPMLKTFKITRLGALRAAGHHLAKRVTTETIEDMLETVRRTGLSIMCFVANRGMIQIHTGSIHNVKRTGRWLNVLDPAFNLHLDTTAIDSVWIVRKPTSDGWVTSIEIFAENGDLIAQFFGARKPGFPELKDWTDLLAALSIESLSTLAEPCESI